jgi:hypothetical protein
MDSSITEKELLEELDAYYQQLPEIQPNDFTVKDLARLRGGSETSWRRRLSDGNIPEGWEAIQVQGKRGAVTWVLRKIGT